jgi:hypothetical protein
MITKKVAFLHDVISMRGSCVAIVDYAHYMKTRWLIDVVYITKPDNYTQDAYDWIAKTFTILTYNTRDDMETILQQQQCDLLYVLKYGLNDNIYSVKVKTIIHCVFDMSEAHGDLYVGVSKTLAEKFNKQCFIPHMVSLQKNTADNFRQEYNIPHDALVFGRHGGTDTLNLDWFFPFVYDFIKQHPNIYFIFMTWPIQPDIPPINNIIHIPCTSEQSIKQKFISTCDAMIVPETLGHTFGLSIAEFSLYEKPIIYYKSPIVWNTAHIEQLEQNGNTLCFQHPDELKNLLTTFKTHKSPNAYKEFSPDSVMKIFKQYIKELETR